jgi:hypothetical protein
MKYKVGDKVKIVKNIINHDLEIGEIGEIIKVDEDDKIRTYRVRGENGNSWVNELDIVYAEYTWEDFLKAPIGTKINFENGDVLVKTDDTEGFENPSGSYSYWELKDFKDNNTDTEYNLGKIIKIEEPTYTIVYEPKEVTMPEIEEMKRLTDELCKTCDELIKKIKEK